MKKEVHNEDAPMKRSTPALKKVAALLIKWREDLGLTAEDIAQKSGLDMDSIERIEKGKGKTPESFAYIGVLINKTSNEETFKRLEELGLATLPQSRKP